MRIRAAMTILFLAGVFGVGVVTASERPNVLFIVVDDLNDWVDCLGGHPLVKTPHIDALAQRGIVFRNAHCQAPLCNPSRTSVLLGKRPETTGVYGLQPWFRDVPGLGDLISLPQCFSGNGYRTLATGKIFHGRFGLREEDREFDVIGPGYDDGPYPPRRVASLPGKQSRGNDWGVIGGRDEERGDWKIASWAAERLQGLPQEPFFLSVGIRLPHVPLFATQQWFNLYPDDESVLPLITRDDRDDTPRFSWYLHWRLPEHRRVFLERAGQWQSQVRAYLACVSFLDAQVGRILQALRESGLEKNTVVVLWSDHGWHIGEKDITGKNTLWEGGTRVVAAVRCGREASTAPPDALRLRCRPVSRAAHRGLTTDDQATLFAAEQRESASSERNVERFVCNTAQLADVTDAEGAFHRPSRVSHRRAVSIDADCVQLAAVHLLQHTEGVAASRSSIEHVHPGLYSQACAERLNKLRKAGSRHVAPRRACRTK